MAEERSLSELAILLKARYREHATIERLFYPDHPLPIEQCYLDLAMIEDKNFHAQKDNQDNTSEVSRDYFLHSYERIQHSQRKLTPEQLLTECRQTPKRIYIEGAAGAGKTTLSQFIAYQWGNDHTVWKHYDFLFRIRLRNLTEANCPDNKIDFIEFLEKECFRFGFSNSLTENEKSELTDYLKSRDRKVLFVLDGYDELIIKTRTIKSLWEELIQSEFDFIITSRPRMSKAELKIRSNVAILGFSDEQVEKYIKYFFDSQHTPNVESKAIKHSLQTFRQNPNLWSLAHIPIQLELLCSIWGDEVKRIPNINLTQLYTLLFEKLLKRCEQKELEHKKNKKININNIKLKNLFNKYSIYIEYLEYLAYLGMEKQAIVLLEDLDNEAYEAIVSSFKNSDKFYRKLEKLGFIKRHNKQTEFLHLTFQEYFMARYIVRCFKNKQSPKNYSSIKDFIIKRKYHSSYEVVWWMITGLLNDEDQALDKFINYFQYLSRELVGLNSMLLLIRCLEECSNGFCEEQKEKQFLYIISWLENNLKKFKFTLHFIINSLSTCPRFTNKILNSNWFDLATRDKQKLKFCIQILVSKNDISTNILQRLILLIRKDKLKNYIIQVLEGQINLPESILKELIALSKDKVFNMYYPIEEIFYKQRALPDSILKELILPINDETNIEKIISILNVQLELSDDILQKIIDQFDYTKLKNLRYFEYLFYDRNTLSIQLLNKLHGFLNSQDESRKYIAVQILKKQKNLPKNIYLHLAKLEKDRFKKINLTLPNRFHKKLLDSFDQFAISSQKDNPSATYVPKNAFVSNIIKKYRFEEILKYLLFVIENSEKSFRRRSCFLTNDEYELLDYIFRILKSNDDLPNNILKLVMRFLTLEAFEELCYMAVPFGKFGYQRTKIFIISRSKDINGMVIRAFDEERYCAAQILRRQKNLNEKIILELIELLNHPSKDICFHAANILSNQEKLSVKALIKIGEIIDTKLFSKRQKLIVKFISGIKVSSLIKILDRYFELSIYIIISKLLILISLQRKLPIYFIKDSFYVGQELFTLSNQRNRYQLVNGLYYAFYELTGTVPKFPMEDRVIFNHYLLSLILDQARALFQFKNSPEPFRYLSDKRIVNNILFHTIAAKVLDINLYDKIIEYARRQVLYKFFYPLNVYHHVFGIVKLFNTNIIKRKFMSNEKDLIWQEKQIEEKVSTEIQEEMISNLSPLSSVHMWQENKTPDTSNIKGIHYEYQYHPEYKRCDIEFEIDDNCDPRVFHFIENLYLKNKNTNFQLDSLENNKQRQLIEMVLDHKPAANTNRPISSALKIQEATFNIKVKSKSASTPSRLNNNPSLSFDNALEEKPTTSSAVSSNAQRKEIADVKSNQAIALFLGQDKSQPSHLEFTTWYHPEICHYLLQLVSNKTNLIRVMFHDAGGNNTATFKKQLRELTLLSNRLDRPALFIGKEPGAENHFICGIVRNGQLLFINPLGISQHDDCYQTFAELVREKILNGLWLANNTLQRREYEGKGLVSCGAIVIELAIHVLTTLSPDSFSAFWKQLKINQPKHHTPSELLYYEIDIQDLLPSSLKEVQHALGPEIYKDILGNIRQHHYQYLQRLPVEYANSNDVSINDYLQTCKNAPSQVLFNALIFENKIITTIDQIPEYELLKGELDIDITCISVNTLTKSKLDFDSQINENNNSLALPVSKELMMQEQTQKYDVFIAEIKGTQEAIDVLISHADLKTRITQELHHISSELQKAKTHARYTNELIRSKAQTTYDNCINIINYLKTTIAQEKNYPIDELNQIISYLENIVNKISPTIELHTYSVTQMQEVQTQGLFFTQRFLNNMLRELSPLGQDFKGLLEAIKMTMGPNRYSCFISYAKPIDEANGPDRFIHSFLDTLHGHLLLAGFNPLLDFKCIEAGEAIETYMKQTLISNHWLLIGTPSLPQRLNQQADVTFETRIETLRKVNKLNNIYPMIPVLVVGNAAQSLPWHKQSDNYINLTQSSYLAGLKQLLQALSRIPEQVYNGLWASFEVKYSEHMQPLSSDFINKLMENEKQRQQATKQALDKKITASYFTNLSGANTNIKISQINQTQNIISSEILASSGHNIEASLDEGITQAALAKTNQLNFDSNSASLLEKTYQDLRERLKEKYKEKRYIERLFYPKDPLSIDAIYVNLQIVKEEEQKAKEEKGNRYKVTEEITRNNDIHWYEALYTAKESIKLKNIFQLFKVGERRRLFIEGRAGIGKSTLCQYIAYCWALPAQEKKCLWQSDFDFIFWIPLRALKVEDSNVIDVIERVCFQTGITKKFTSYERSLLEQLIKEKNILWLLDGYDELSIPKESKLERLWDDLLNENNVILTSRPGYGKSLPNCRRVEIIGFSDKQIQKYIQRFYQTLKQEEDKNVENVKLLQQLLQTNNSIYGIAHVPINLELLCSMCEQKQLRAADVMTLTELYSGIVKSLYERHAMLKKEKTTTEITAMIDILDSEDYAMVTLFLECLAFKGIEQHEILLTQKHLSEVKKELIEAQQEFPLDILLKQAKELGVIKSVTDGMHESYYFLHLTFQEYFAACFIVRYIENHEHELSNIAVYKNQLLVDIKYKPNYAIALPFVAGLLSEIKRNDFFNELINNSIDLVGHYGLLLNLKCLEECKLKININYSNNIIDSLKEAIKFSFSKFDYDLRASLAQALSLCPLVFSDKRIKGYFREYLNKKDIKNFFYNEIMFLSTIKHNDDDINSDFSSFLDYNDHIYDRNDPYEIEFTEEFYSIIPAQAAKNLLVNNFSNKKAYKVLLCSLQDKGYSTDSDEENGFFSDTSEFIANHIDSENLLDAKKFTKNLLNLSASKYLKPPGVTLIILGKLKRIDKGDLDDLLDLYDKIVSHTFTSSCTSLYSKVSCTMLYELFFYVFAKHAKLCDRMLDILLGNLQLSISDSYYNQYDKIMLCFESNSNKHENSFIYSYVESFFKIINLQFLHSSQTTDLINFKLNMYKKLFALEAIKYCFKVDPKIKVILVDLLKDKDPAVKAYIIKAFMHNDAVIDIFQEILDILRCETPKQLKQIAIQAVATIKEIPDDKKTIIIELIEKNLSKTFIDNLNLIYLGNYHIFSILLKAYGISNNFASVLSIDILEHIKYYDPIDLLNKLKNIKEDDKKTLLRAIKHLNDLTRELGGFSTSNPEVKKKALNAFSFPDLSLYLKGIKFDHFKKFEDNRIYSLPVSIDILFKSTPLSSLFSHYLLIKNEELLSVIVKKARKECIAIYVKNNWLCFYENNELKNYDICSNLETVVQYFNGLVRNNRKIINTGAASLADELVLQDKNLSEDESTSGEYETIESSKSNEEEEDEPQQALALSLQFPQPNNNAGLTRHGIFASPSTIAQNNNINMPSQHEIQSNYANALAVPLSHKQKISEDYYVETDSSDSSGYETAESDEFNEEKKVIHKSRANS